MKLRFDRYWILVLCLSLFVLTANASFARTWYVEKDGSGDYTVIQDAVDAAASGDTVRIGPGRFEEYQTYAYPGGLYDVVVYSQHSSLYILGSATLSTIVSSTAVGAGDYSAAVFFDASGDGDGLIVEGLTIEGGFFGAVLLKGVASFSDVRVADVQHGLVYYSTGSVSTCRFDNISDTGITARANAHDLSVLDSTSKCNRQVDSCFHSLP